jgi:nucleoside-diphosphate-sugar epimerase
MPKPLMGSHESHKKRILVTGARGFVGRAVLKALAADGLDVVAVTSGSTPDAGDAHLRWVRADLLAEADVDGLCAAVGATDLIHLAWCAKPGGYLTSPENIAWVTATLHLLEAFRKHGGMGAVIAGSSYEYDLRYGLMNEDLTPLGPSTPYGRAKRSCGDLAALWAELHGLPVAWGRIFQAYGPGEAEGRLFPSVIQAFLSGEEARCTHGRQLRDFIHVDDIASALVHLLAGRHSGAFNVGTGVPSALRQAVDHLAIQTGCADLVQYGAISARSDDAALLVADMTKLYATGWRPRFDLASGLDDMLGRWRSRSR